MEITVIISLLGLPSSDLNIININIVLQCMENMEIDYESAGTPILGRKHY